MPDLNPLLLCVEPPPIPLAHAWAARYDGAHGPALDLCQAVPGWPAHPELLDRLSRAAADPATTRYGLINGDLDLRRAYAVEQNRIGGGDVTPDQVAITSGCNQAFFLAMLALARAGDNVLLPVPWFWNHQQTCAMLGIEARPLPCHAEASFVPAVEEAETLIDDRSRAIVLITPNNPTGAVYPPETIAAFFELCRRRGLWLILDETYRDFLPPGQSRAHALFADADWAETLVGLYSFSKAYCIPGARVGAVTAAAPIIDQLVKALDCLHICPQRPAQVALTWAIPSLIAWREENRARIGARATAMRNAVIAASGWTLDSIGAYFAYVRHPAAAPAAVVAERLSAGFGATGLPGPAFGPGQERHLRLAFANVDREGLASLPQRLTMAGGADPTRIAPLPAARA